MLILAVVRRPVFCCLSLFQVFWNDQGKYLPVNHVNSGSHSSERFVLQKTDETSWYLSTSYWSRIRMKPQPAYTSPNRDATWKEGLWNKCLCFPGRLSPLLRPMVCWRQQYKIDFTLSRLLHSLLLYTIKTSTALANNLGIPWKHAQ